MTPKEILLEAQQRISEYAGGDPDKWWYTNRFVFARLQLDERETKAPIKRKLLDANTPCHGCGKHFDSTRDIHLHRLDGDKGYSEGNCVLLHPDCHRRIQALQRKDAEKPSGREPTVVKWSKRYDDKAFRYWWDIAPPFKEYMCNLEAIEFAKKDTKERCIVSVQDLKGFLVQDRKTTRSQGNWGIKVLRDHPNELAFEPGSRADDWLFLRVVWLNEKED